mgnify:CR=1 FL=1
MAWMRDSVVLALTMVIGKRNMDDTLSLTSLHSLAGKPILKIKGVAVLWTLFIEVEIINCKVWN